MKKAALIAVCIIMLAALCACAGGESNETESTSGKTVTFVNGITDADVWILPETQENLKTTVWGKATLPGIKAGESRTFPLCEPGDDGLYMLRVIDTGGFFFSANGIALDDGMTLKITGDDRQALKAEVTSPGGTITVEYELFSARL